MKNLKPIIAFVLLSSFLKAQDSTKAINHEIGFNTVSLIKQVISNNPNNTLSQLPYDIFYNLYFKDKIGIRLGLGINNSNSQTKIDGQNEPRKTTRNSISGRIGLSYNFVKQNRVTLNAFADMIYENFELRTTNTETVQSFGDPVHNITTTTVDQTNGMGGQLGVGVKYNLYKHLSLYAEIPFTFLSSTVTSNVLIEEDGFPDDITNSKSTGTSVKIIVPATIYLVLRF
jgi:hypothetical protein